VWVCGDYVRKGQRVPFSQQWATLCEACGFRLLHWHRAWKVERYGVQMRQDGGEDVQEISRVSFFRRLANAKGGAKIESEEVLCCERV